jgi:hypothetical protein
MITGVFLAISQIISVHNFLSYERILFNKFKEGCLSFSRYGESKNTNAWIDGKPGIELPS